MRGRSHRRGPALCRTELALRCSATGYPGSDVSVTSFGMLVRFASAIDAIYGVNGCKGCTVSTRELDGQHVLIVEDEVVISMELELALREAGAEVIGPASSVSSALEAIESARELDLAVLDINLGGIAAYPVAEVLRSRGVPFVFATGYGADEVSPENAGAVYLGKPVTMPQVTAALAKLARQHRLRSDAAPRTPR
jgi:CheY-like chemotaxis protein